MPCHWLSTTRDSMRVVWGSVTMSHRASAGGAAGTVRSSIRMKRQPPLNGTSRAATWPAENSATVQASSRRAKGEDRRDITIPWLKIIHSGSVRMTHQERKTKGVRTRVRKASLGRTYRGGRRRRMRRLMQTNLTPLRERGLVERDQFAPGSLRVRLAVDRLSVLERHVRDAPAVEGFGIDFDLRRHLCRGKRLAQLVLRIGLAHVVVRRHAEIHPCLDFRREQMRARGRVGHQSPAVERRARANSIRRRGGGPHHERAAHTIALRANLPGFVDRRLRIEERNAG